MCTTLSPDAACELIQITAEEGKLPQECIVEHCHGVPLHLEQNTLMTIIAFVENLSRKRRGVSLICVDESVDDL